MRPAPDPSSPAGPRSRTLSETPSWRRSTRPSVRAPFAREVRAARSTTRDPNPSESPAPAGCRIQPRQIPGPARLPLTSSLPRPPSAPPRAAAAQMQRFSDEVMTALQGVVAKLAKLESRAEESDAKLAEVSRDLRAVADALASSKAAPEPEPEPASPATPAPAPALASAPAPSPRPRPRLHPRPPPRPRLRPSRARGASSAAADVRLGTSRRPPSRSAFLPGRRPRSSSSNSNSGASPRPRLSRHPGRHPSRHPSRRLLRRSPRRRTSSRDGSAPPAVALPSGAGSGRHASPSSPPPGPSDGGRGYPPPGAPPHPHAPPPPYPGGPGAYVAPPPPHRHPQYPGPPEARVPGIRPGRTGGRRRLRARRPRRCRTRA